MTRRVLALVGMLALGLVLVARADDPDKPKDNSGSSNIIENKNKAIEQQEILQRQFKDFEQALLRVARRLARSAKPEDRERAANLKKAIELAGNENTDAKFDKLINTLKGSKAATVQEIEDAMTTNKMLAEDIRKILDLLMTDNRAEEIKREKARLEALIKMLDKAIRNQKFVRAHTESGRMEKDPLHRAQHKVTKETEDIAKAMGRDAKDGNGKGKDSKGEGKGQGKGKAADGKGEGKGQSAKADSKGEGKGQGSKGQGKGQGQQSADAKKGNSKPQPGGDQPQQAADATPGRKQVQDANNYQRQAEEEIQKEKKDVASAKQDKAIDELEKARKKLEEILRQLREEEMERLLAALQARCEHMLLIQIQVYEGTVATEKAIAENSDKKPTRVNEQKSLQLSDREREITRESEKAIALLRGEGSAVAFPVAFEQVRDDSTHVTRRLGTVDVGTVTQVIEQDIIANLKEMIAALKKARQDMEAKKGQPSPPNPNSNQKLIDLLAELKMIRSMQIRVNSRTQTYARQYPGEQAEDAEIEKELNNLAQRQQKIFDVTNDIYRGKNK